MKELKTYNERGAIVVDEDSGKLFAEYMRA
jgi:hypothetical protein